MESDELFPCSLILVLTKIQAIPPFMIFAALFHIDFITLLFSFIPICAHLNRIPRSSLDYRYAQALLCVHQLLFIPVTRDRENLF